MAGPGAPARAGPAEPSRGLPDGADPSDMERILEPVAVLLNGVLPGWVALPSLTFQLPHPVYWLGLALFPPLAMWLVARAGQREPRRLSTAIAYLLWATGGLAGLHRFYLRSNLAGLVYVLLFVLILVANSLGTDARNVKSGFDNDLKIAEFKLDRAEQKLEPGDTEAEAAVAEARATRDRVKAEAEAAARALDRWRTLAGAIFYLIVLMLILDAILIPSLLRRCARDEAHLPAVAEVEIMKRGSKPDPRDAITTPFIRLIERISGWSGEFVAYWSVLAVFVYYYEVLARYVFNSPTNWAHESMFLMFGMQYLISGAYAMREGAHVRVDVIYERFGPKTRAAIDIVTSVVFFIFTATLIVTGFLFARDSALVLEVSFTEWAIQYWPVKLTLVLGGVLLLLQGIAKLMRDILYVTGTGAR